MEEHCGESPKEGTEKLRGGTTVSHPSTLVCVPACPRLHTAPQLSYISQSYEVLVLLGLPVKNLQLTVPLSEAKQ